MEKNKMKILYVTAEAAPFAASGGLGDVLGALPAAVGNRDDVDTACILPLYDSVSNKYRNEMVKVCDISFMLSWRRTGASVYSLNYKGITYYFVENHYYFDRNRLYGEHDDAERFAFFSMAVIEFILASGNIPDILHANDWQTALSVVYLKTKYSQNKLLADVKTVYTIHNIEYQGKFNPYILGDIFALENEYLDVMCHNGDINLMKAAIVLSDRVTTVSPNYAEELNHDFFAFGLASVIDMARNKLVGIVNGIDYSVFSPDAGDIDYKFTKRTVKSGKEKNKISLYSSLGLEYDKSKPLVVMITRLASQKGIDLLLHIAEELLGENLDLVVLGTGEREYEDQLAALEYNHGNMRALLKFDRVISKKLYASADIFLMPSKSEPCGLAQMISCAYGTVPIVRSVGGLCDTIIPYDNEFSNGFRFDNYNAHELLYTVKRALEVYKNEREWSSLRRRAINSDFSWERSAANYISLYTDLLK